MQRTAGLPPATRAGERGDDLTDLGLLGIGAAIGVATTAPVGPVNIMVIQRTFRRGLFAGWSAGLGAVVADALYAAMAAFGVTAVSDFVQTHAVAVQFIGALVLFWFGWRIMNAHPHLDGDERDSQRGFIGGLLTAFIMTITNPGAVLGFIALFGGLGDLAPAPGDWIGALTLVAGLIIGSSSWWLMIAGFVTLLRGRMNDIWLMRINRTAGVLLVVFGIAVLGRALWTLLS